ncbi:ABC transporter substrate-binding protein [Aeromicrobium wangtongii]|uniref:ABC transporter substrate-binding protein n=1 Tax=Aeromicrobium wangtongii TaxID=2969247 RepID=A0ABY5M5W7_9ACTN|nr:ABC transporter substrate-binding protein [Aeromicrobium wangtongii]MCD9199944.1 ABC transporter substrate-binding protein [Aeromicrobium wangtongii]UUP13560.1 ABC transporter substrate-binding protein [Aeromicrobium wangtongii]
MKKSLAIVIAASLAALAACGSGSESSEGPSSSKPVKITVANLAVTNSAGLVLGVEKGFFTDEGLSVTIKDTPAASTVPSVVSGDAQFAFTGIPPLINARSNALPIKAVAPAAGYPEDLSTSQIRLIAQKGGDITDVTQLEGKKIAVDTLYQLPHLSIIQALKSKGVDPTKITFTEVPYPSMTEALASGKVDAADMGDPFLSQALAAGHTDLLSNGEGFDPAATQVIWIASESYIAKNPKIVKAFRRAVVKSNEYAQANPDEVRKIVPSYMEGTDKVADKILLPQYTTTIDQKVFSVYNDLLTEFKVTKKSVDGKEAVAQE